MLQLPLQLGERAHVFTDSTASTTWGKQSSMADQTKKRRWLSRIPRIGEFVEKNLSLLEQLGVKNTIGAAMSAAIITAASWFWNNVPWYAALGGFLVATYIILGIIHRIQLIRSASKFDPSAYEKLGERLVVLSKDIFRFLADRQRDQLEQHRRNPYGDLANPRDHWQEDRDFEAVTGRLFFERFGAQVLGSLALLQKIGVQIPPHVVVTARYHPDGLPQFLAVMGDLLSQGFITEAVEISRDRNFMWQIQH